MMARRILWLELPAAHTMNGVKYALPFALFACLLFGACSSSSDPDGCATSVDCPSGEMCVNGSCVVSGEDGGTDAAAPTDASGEDGAVESDGGADTGSMDAGPAECGAPCTLDTPCAVGIYECDGDLIECVANGPAPAGTECRAAEGACDVAEFCDGSSMECPVDGAQDAGETCRPADGACDVAEQCDGAAKTCPLDTFTETGTPCADGFCDGMGACQDSCIPNAPCGLPAAPCRVGMTDCSSGTPQCVAGGNAPDGTTCAADEVGSFGACNYDDDCDESGSRSRTRTRYQCAAGSCQAMAASESEACSRDQDGTSCGPTGTGSWSSCGGFVGACGEAGTRSRSVTVQRCVAGSCQGSTTTENQSCSRNTDGDSCGSTTNGSWGACDYGGPCDESASQSRSVTTRVCADAACVPMNSTETRGCSRDTDSAHCGSATTGAWSSCSYMGTCTQTGERSRTVTQPTCQSGACVGVDSTEDDTCSRNTNGISCGPSAGCLNFACQAGSCREQPGGCPAGQTCCGPDGCWAICP